MFNSLCIVKRKKYILADICGQNLVVNVLIIGQNSEYAVTTACNEVQHELPFVF